MPRCKLVENVVGVQTRDVAQTMNSKHLISLQNTSQSLIKEMPTKFSFSFLHEIDPLERSVLVFFARKARGCILFSSSFHSVLLCVLKLDRSSSCVWAFVSQTPSQVPSFCPLISGSEKETETHNRSDVSLPHKTKQNSS